MDTKLNADEISALQSLDSDSPLHLGMLREGDLPQRLFCFNLVTRQPSGKTVLTRSGERLLFRQACISALMAIERGEPLTISNDVDKWLTSSGFIKAGTDPSSSPRAISQRGRLWLAAGEDDPVPPVREATAADFERRRALVESA